jgi:hypothetical protein
MLDNFAWLVNTKIPNQAFSSTSLLPEHPLERARAKEGILAEIHLPAGIPVAYLDLIRDRKEWELLLARDMWIRVTHVRVARGVKCLTAEVIP